MFSELSATAELARQVWASDVRHGESSQAGMKGVYLSEGN